VVVRRCGSSMLCTAGSLFFIKEVNESKERHERAATNMARARANARLNVP
jgi:hypothetical protein